MKNVINCIDKQDAFDQAKRAKSYYPFRHIAIVDMHGKWGYVIGKTMHKLNNLVKAGYPVYIIRFD